MVQKTQMAAGNKTARAPISAHPLFAAVVIAWFAALFGLSSAVLPARSLEALAGATGLASLVPAAAPPLGLTARIAIALAAAMAGGIVGWLAARQVRSAQAGTREHGQARRTREEWHDTSARPPLRALEELESESFDSYIDDVRDVRAGSETAEALPQPAEPEQAEPEQAQLEEAGTDGQTGEHMADASLPGEAPAVEEHRFTAEAIPPLAVHAPIASASAGKPVTQRPLNQLGMVELVERLAHAIQDRQTAAPPAGVPAFAADAVKNESAGYGSLLGLRQNAGPAATASEPLVVFPGQEERHPAAAGPSREAVASGTGAEPAVQAAGPEDTEHALRAALANLQRISGAA